MNSRVRPVGPKERKLMSLLSNGEYEAADELFKEGGLYLDAMVERGKPMVSRFTAVGDAGAVEWLINHGAKPDSILYGVSPVFYASREGDLAMVQSLVNAGSDLNRPGPGGMTPIFAAAWNGHREVFVALLEMGANTRHLDKHGRDVFQIASKNPKIGADFVAELRADKLDKLEREVKAETPEVVEEAAAAQAVVARRAKKF